MAKIDSSKLLPSSKESSAIVKVDKPSVDIKEKKVNLASSLKPIDLKSSALSRDVVKDKKVDDAKDANNKLVKIEKFFKSDLLVSRKKAEEKRKEKEKQDFGEAEKKLEFPKLKGFQLPKLPSLPSLGIFERIKRFLFFTAIGWLLPKIIEFMPKLNGIIKVIGNVYQFAEGLFGKLFDGFMSLVKFGGDLKDKTIGFIANTRVGSSGNFQKEFDKLEKLFNTFTDAAIIAGLLAVDIGAAAFDEYNKWNRKNRPKPGEPTKPKEPRKPGKPPVTTGRGGQKGLGKGKKVKVTGGKKPSWWKGFIPKFKLPPWMEKIASRLQGGPFKKLAGPFKKFLGAAIPFAGSYFGDIDARSRFDSGDNVGGWLARTSAILDGFAGTTAVIGAGFLSSIIGTPVAAFLGAASGIATGISMAIDALLLVRDILNEFNIKTFSQGGKIFRKYQGGGTATRGGKPINAPKRRTITPTKRKPFIIKPPKSKPGKDVGGDRIKALYPDPNPVKVMSLQEWLSTPDQAGTYAQYLERKKRSTRTDNSKPKPNSYKALTSTAKILKEIPLIGGIMGAAVDVALGQKLDYKIIKSLSSGIGYLVESLANQRINLSVSSLNREISSFSDGGYVSPSRELKKNYDSLSSGDLISKVIGPSIEQRVNEAIQSIQKELMKQKKGTREREDGRIEGGFMSGGEYGGYTPPTGIQKDIYEYLINVKKLNDIQALGLMANIHRESSFIPNNKQPGGPGVGLFQFSEQTRKAKFLRAVPDWETNWKKQIDYALSESVGPQYLTKTFSSAQQAADWWMDEWEKPSDRVGGSRKHAKYLRTIRRAPSGSVRFREASSSNIEIIGGIRPSTLIPTSRQGWRWGRMHKGVDLAVKEGEPISSAQDAKVIWAGDKGDGYGYSVILRYSNGAETRFAHFKKIGSEVRTGQKINAGQIIGYEGKTGNSIGSHLHFEYYPKGGAMTYEGYGDAWSVVDNYFRYGGKVRVRVPSKPMDSANVEQNTQRQPGASRPGQSQRPQNPANVLKSLVKKSFIPFDVDGNLYVMRYYENGNRRIFRAINIPISGPVPIPGSEVKSSDPSYKIIIKFANEKTKDMYPLPLNFFENQSGGFIPSSKSNRPIPNSFTSYETYGSGMMFAIQPVIIEKQIPVSSGSKTIAFPVAISVNSNMNNLSLSRG